MHKGLAISAAVAAALAVTATSVAPATAGSRIVRGPDEVTVDIVALYGSGCPIGSTWASILYDSKMLKLEEETGWRPGPLRPLAYPTSGIMDAVHHIFTAEGGTKVGEPKDGFVSTRVAWVPLEDTPKLIAENSFPRAPRLACYLCSAGGADEATSR